MGGLPCAKQIIDQRNALVQAMDCMGASIQLYADQTQPTQDMANDFQQACETVAVAAAKIERYVTTGG